MTARTVQRRLTTLATVGGATALLLAACTSDPGPPSTAPTEAPTTAAPGPREPTSTPGPGDPTAVGTSPGSNYLSITVDNIVGTWLTADENGWLWSFYADGTVLWTNPSATNDGGPHETTPYSLESGELISPATCVWELDIWADGMMYGVIVDGQDCTAGELWPWARLSPAPGVASLELEPLPTTAPTAPTDLLDVSRVWWKQESGHVLAITYDLAARTARYLLDDDGDPFADPDDTGAATLDEAGAVTLRSSGSASCPADAPVTLSGDLTDVDGPATGLTLSWAAEEVGPAATCAAHEGLGGTWVAVT